MFEYKKFEPTEPLKLNYENLYVWPVNHNEYMGLFGDMQYIFTEEEINEMCDKINSIGCTSFQLSTEELAALIEKIKGCS